MDGQLKDRQHAAIEHACQRDTRLQLLMLYGSRARGDAHDGSDWDFAYVAQAGFDAPACLTELIWELGTERIDLVDLREAGALLRYRVARDGVVMFATTGAYEGFWMQAVSFWCDAGRQIREAYADMLKGLAEGA